MGLKGRSKLQRDERRILSPEPEREECSGVGEHGKMHIGLKLMDVLVSQNEANAEFPKL
jgi:hypothetical protein